MANVEKINLAFIGAGKLSKTLLAGIVLSGKFPQGQLFASVRTQESLKLLREGWPEIFASTSNSDLLKKLSTQDSSSRSIILIGVKPYDLKEILRAHKDEFPKNALILSLAAGMETMEFSKELVGRDDLRIGRLMANTACSTGKGLMALDSKVAVSLGNAEKNILKLMGTLSVIDEKEFDAFTVMAASAPAFMLEWVRGMKNASIKLGLDEKSAQDIALGLMAGTQAQLSENFSPEDLIKQIATPGGMTAEGLDVLKNENLEKTIQSAASARFQKAKAWKS